MTTPSLSSRGRLADSFSDLFILGQTLKETADLGKTETLWIRLEQLFHEADKRGVDLGYPRDVLDDARFAMVAFLDEMILNSPWPQRDEWALQPLQFRFFGTRIAGEEFFIKLNIIRRAMPINMALLEIFYSCLVLGYEGQYTLEDREKLKGLIHDIYREFHAKEKDTLLLSPHGERPEEVLELVKHRLPAWVVVVASVAIILFVYTGFSLLIKYDASTVADELRIRGSEIIR